MPAFTWDVDPVLVHFPPSLSWLPVERIRYYSLLYVGVFLGGFKLLDCQLHRAGHLLATTGARKMEHSRRAQR